jgi:hypothetical protein
MILYVPVGEAIYPNIPECKDAFAWFCTTSDRFLTFNGHQEWQTWEHFEDDWRSEGKHKYDRWIIPLERFRSLFPSANAQVDPPAPPR